MYTVPFEDAKDDDPHFLVLHAVINSDPDRLQRTMLSLTVEERCRLLCKKARIAGTIPFYTIMMNAPLFPVLFKDIPEIHWPKILAILEDGNTPLTEAISWGNTLVVKRFLDSVRNPQVKAQLLATTNHQGKTLKELYEAKER